MTFAVLLLNLLLLQNPEEIYISNEFGMALKRIGWYRRDEYSYVLVVTETQDKQIKTLFLDQEEIKRWEIGADEERIYTDGQLSEKKRYDRNRVIEEAFYSDGVLDRRSLYRYGKRGVSQSETYDGSGQILYRDRYALSLDGELRSITRTWNDGTVQNLALISGDGKLSEERDSAGDREVVYRYDEASNLYSREVWVQGQMSLREDTEYEENRIKRRLLNDFNSGRTIRIEYDDAGLPVEEIVLSGDKEIERTTTEWNAEGQKIKIQRNGEQGLEYWLMHYTDGELRQEEYWLRGSLQKMIHYLEEGQRIEELFRAGAIFIRIHYREEEKLREEYIESGEIVKVRTYP